LEAAIAEYARVVEDQPRDWTTVNALGDLHARAGQPDKAAAQYSRIAEHFVREGFLSKAAALFKKVLKIRPDDEQAQLQLAEVSAEQGLLADAKSHFAIIAERRRGRGDRRGALEIVVRLGSLDPGDFEARFTAARAVEESGDSGEAAERLRTLAGELEERGRPADAVRALREVVRLEPADLPSRGRLARALLAAGDVAGAQSFLTRETAGEDPGLLLAYLEIEGRAGRFAESAELLRDLLARDNRLDDRVMQLGWSLCEQNPGACYVCVEAVADVFVTGSDWMAASAALTEFLARVPAHVPALLKLVEVCVDGGLESAMYEAQTQLADAYLAAGQAAEARVIAEDLVAREPWERVHIERFRRALQMLGESNPDHVIAERLSGQTPFISTDHFAHLSRSGDTAGAWAPDHTAAPHAAGVAARAGGDEAAGGEDGAAPAAAENGGGPRALETRPHVDLDGVLPDLNAATSPAKASQSLADVFKDFRAEVSRESSREAADEQLRLAMTYREIGMADEAMTALRDAARSPRHRFEAASLLGRMYRQRGDIPHAIEWLERAAEAPAPTAEVGLALLYELGDVLEHAHETARALAVFLELQAEVDEYRDVQARVDRLARLQTGG
jgi:tetratricopeptide (TPR) repeat protein